MNASSPNPDRKPFWRRRSAIVIGLGLGCLVAWFILRGESPEKEKPAESAISVRAVTASRQDVQSWVFAEGTARSAEREYLTFQGAGRVVFIAPELREGALVEKNALLAYQDQRRIKADLTDSETSLAVARDALAQAKAQAILAEKTLSRFATLIEKKSASLQEYDEAKAQWEKARADEASAESRIGAAEAKLKQTQVVQEDTEIRSPVDGMVAYLNIEQGQYFMPSVVRTDSESAALNSVPVVIINPGKFEIDVEIPDFERGRVASGQLVYIKAGSNSAKAPDMAAGRDSYITGEVYSVSPAVSPSGRAIQVKIRTTGSVVDLKDGMFVTAWIATEKVGDAIRVPLEALLYRENQPYVFAIDPDTRRAARRDVKLGLPGNNESVVLEGVKVGDVLVTDGRYQVSDGSLVRVLDEASSKSNSSASKNSDER